MLEEMRDRRYNEYALVLQKAFRKFNAVNYYNKLKNEAADIMQGKKERRSLSVNRKFYGDYIGLDRENLAIRALIPKKENVEFAQTCIKYDRQFKKQKRDFILTNKAMYIIGREDVNKSSLPGISLLNKKKQIIEVIKRRIEYSEISKIAVSPLADNFLVLFPNNQFGSLLEIEFKTEFLTTLSKRYKESTGRPLNLVFTDS